MKADNFYKENEKYLALKKQLSYEQRVLLADVVNEAILHGIDIMASNLGITDKK